MLARAAAVEAASEHPVAAAIVAAARQRDLPIRDVTDFANEPGVGVSGVVDGARVTVSRAGSIGRGRSAGAEPAQPGTEVDVAWDGRVRGVLRLADAVKPTSAAAIAELNAMGITAVLLTGDSAAVAQRVAAEVGIAAADVIAGVLPTGKAEVITRLAGRGQTGRDGR